MHCIPMEKYLVVLVAVAALAALFSGYAGQQAPAAQNSSAVNFTMANITKTETVVLETSMGNIEIGLNREKAPKTVDNFIGYVKSGFYNGTVFHRVMKGFMAQGGGFTPKGMEKPTQAPIKLESGNGLSNLRGTVAMARTSDPDSATSQFFISTVDNKFLDYSAGNPGYAVFGKVAKGMDVVDAITSAKTSIRGPYSDWPINDIVITGAYIKQRGLISWQKTRRLVLGLGLCSSGAERCFWAEGMTTRKRRQACLTEPENGQCQAESCISANRLSKAQEGK
jgi:peptidyl-prolyl cis-trans isomerase A (cyclophilin A)